MSITKALAELSSQWSSYDHMEKYYGMSLPDTLLEGSWRVWSDGRKIASPMVDISNRRVNRHLFEVFMQASGWLPVKIAAARIGMAKESLLQIVATLSQLNRLPVNPLIGDQLIEARFVSDIHKHFAGTRSKVFSDQSSYDDQLHKAIAKEIKVVVKPLFCETSKEIKEKEYAYTFDSLTYDPLGLRYQVWLDFKKPMSVEPDVCSQATYVSNERVLKKFTFGAEPQVSKKIRNAFGK